MKQEVAQFLHEQVFTRFKTPLKIIFNNGP
jgi:hypothetical protein